MISVGHDRSTTPPPSISRPGLSLDTSSFSSPSSPVSPSAAILAPWPLRPTPSDSLQDHSITPQLSIAGPSAPSPPPLDPNVSCPRFPQDVAEVVPPPMTEVSLEIYVDDEGLNSLEKIYIFCRSKVTMNRVFISRSLHTFLPGVSPLEGVEYVLPLLNGLAMDEEDAVKEALVVNLVAIMWWFFENCRLIEDEPPAEQEDPPLLPVQTFTPILGSLLIDHNTMVGGPARFAVVEILNRLRSADDRGEDHPPFGNKERKMLEQEIVHQVIIGMGRLDVSEENFPSPSPISKPELTSAFPSALSPPSSMIENSLILSPPSPSNLRSPQSSISQVESSQSVQTLASPLTPPVPALSPGILSLSPDSPLGPTSPPSQEQQSSVSFASASASQAVDAFDNWVPPSPHPNSEATFGGSAVVEGYSNEDDGWLMAEGQHNQDTQDDANEQAAIGRLSSMSLIATVTAHAKLPEETIRAFADEVAYIGGDPLYWVRREASFAVGALAKVVPTEVVLLSLLPLFEALARDTIWHVRHSAVFALPGILTRLTPHHRRALALKTLLSLEKDGAPTVRSGVLEVLGEVIYTFHRDDGGAPEELVDLFVGREEGMEQRQHETSTGHWRSGSITTKMKKPSGALSSVFETDEDSSEKDDAAQADRSDMFGPKPVVMGTPGGFFHDPTRALITSFNYPAVALSLGPRRWGEVRGYYLALTRDGNVRVRRTIAAGLGEMARILGCELTQRDLVDVWQDMVHDTEDGQTRLKALGGVCLFIGALEGAARESVVGGLVELWERWLTGWRERECLTRAIPALAGLAEGQGEVVRTLMGKALMDNVAAVREAAIGAITHVLRAFESRPHLAEALRDDLQGLARADMCRRRATYVACYRALAEGDSGQSEIARDEFWKHIIQLSSDAVVDVRIGVARLLGVVCDKFYPQPSSRPPHILEVIRRLNQDPSRDVRAFVAFLLVPVDATQLRPSPTLATPPVMFATFSRPPPKTPPLGMLVEGMQDLDIEDDVSMELAVQDDRLPGHGVAVPGRTGRGSPLIMPGKENEERRHGETVLATSPFKPPPLQRPRPDHWELQ